MQVYGIFCAKVSRVIRDAQILPARNNPNIGITPQLEYSVRVMHGEDADATLVRCRPHPPGELLWAN